MAEAESFKGRPTVSPHPPPEYSISSATEAGTTAGVKEDLGQYDAKGVLRTSSLRQQRKITRHDGESWYSDSIKDGVRFSVRLSTVTGTHTGRFVPTKAGYPGIRQPEDAVQRFL
jgi:hypothetical protein